MSGTRTFSTEGAAGEALAAFLRERTGEPWRTVKGWIASGRVRVNGEVATDAGQRLRGAEEVALLEQGGRPGPRPEVRIVHDDTHVVVIDKPAGVMSVPYEGERDTALALVRDAWRRQGRPSAPLLVVHRLDKDTSGLLLFAKSKRAESELARRFRAHDVERTYLAVAHGDVAEGRLESHLVEDRGDGLRGSTSLPGQGKRAVTHVRPLETLGPAGRRATICEVRLETGRTHQVRIHLAEAGHPLVGETVYVRDFVAAGGRLLASPRLLLHAARLAFIHPLSGEPLEFRSPPPPDFRAVVETLRRG